MHLESLVRTTLASWKIKTLLIVLVGAGAFTSGRSQTLFSDDFSRTTNAGVLAPWVAQAGTWTVGGGVLSGTIPAQSLGWAYITNSFTNYAVQARVRFTSTSAVGGGIGARWNPVVGSHYAAWVYPDNSAAGQNILRLIKFQDYFGGWEFNNVASVPMAQVSLAPVGTNWHTLNVAVQGNQITVYYDSNQVVSVVDTESNPYLTGAIGVGIASDSNPYNFLVDDVTVTALPARLMALNDLYVVRQGGSLSVSAPGVLANDTAVAKTNFTATLVNAPTRGTLTFNANGAFTYVPSNGVVGMDAFTYRASDGFSNSGLATVSIDVTPSTNAFYDDFSRPANGSSSLAPWVTGLGVWSVSGGSLLGTASQANDYSGCFVPTNWGDFTAQMRFQLPAGAWACGLIGRLNTNTGASYVANVYPEGSPLGPTPALRLIKFHDWLTWSPSFTPMVLVPLPPVGTSPHTLRMTCQGNVIDVYFDGAQIVHMADTNVDGIAPYLSGAAGVHMYMDAPFTATFDNFTVTPIVASNAPPVITSQPVSSTNNAGTTATFTVGASGVSLSYQWQKGTASINGATNATLTLPSVTDPSAGSYRAIVSNPYGSVTSAVATLTIIDPPVIVTQPASQTNNLGSNVTFTVSVNGTSPAFQWRKNGGNIGNGGNVSGATTSALSLANIAAGEAGSYTVVITNSAGSVTSAVATLTVAGAPPVITSQPVSRTNNAGTTATFTVGATGTGLLYQWQKGTSPINNATNATLTLASVSDPDAGSYRAIVSNPYGSATSAVVTLTIIDPPIIVTQPASQTNNVGSNITFSVSVTGTSPAFQWRKNGANLANGGNVSGATASALSLANIAAGDGGSYAVVITNSAGSVTSAVATLTVVGAPPVITSQPVSRTNNAGTTATFTVGATGTGLLYQWQKGTAPINSATNATLTLASVSDADAASYRAIVSNPYGSVTSSVATLTIINPPVIVTQPASQTNNVGSNVTFTVSVNGTSPAFQWRKNGANLADGGNVSGATTSALSLANIVAGDAGSYAVVVTNSAGSVTSAVATLTVTGPPVITSQPVSRTNSTGTTATFAVGASGVSLSFQWQKGAAPINGATNATLTLPSVSASDAGSYSAIVSNPFGSVTSAVVTLTIIDGPVIVTQPVSQTNNLGATISFNVSVTGSSPAYQWRKNGTNVTNGGRISGATTSALTITNIAASDAGSYTVAVTNVAGSVTSAVATLTVIVPPVITSQPASRTNNAGTTATFTVGASGIALLYQWQKGTAPINGATNATLALNAVSDLDVGSYRAIVSNSAGSVTSAVATLTIINPPVIVTQPISRTNDAGTTATFSVSVSGTSPAFQWRKNGTNMTNGGNISGATTSTLTLANIGLIDAASYAVVVANAAGSVTSSPAFLTVISTNPPWRLFSDDFTRPADPGLLSPWGLSQSDDWTISAGLLTGTSKGQGYGNLYVTNVWTNYAVQAQVRFSAGSYGGGLGAYDNGSGGTHYGAWIFPDGSSGGANTLKLFKFKNWKTSIYTMQQTNLPSVGTNWHTLTLAVFGSRVAAFYDGVQMLNTTDTDSPALTSGGVSIDLLAPGSSDRMVVDNVVVNSITGVSPFEVLSTYAPSIQSVALANGNATVRWTTWPGMTYRLQYSDNLASGTWSNASPEILANTGLVTATNAVGSATQRFYRVLLVK